MSRGKRIAGFVGAIPPSLWALLAGVAWALCFSERGLVVAPWLALTPLVLLLGTKRPVWLSFLHGVAFWTASLYWIVATLMTYGRLPLPLAVISLLLLAALLSFLFWVPFGVIGERLWRAGGWRASLGLPALWVGLEWMREYIFSGFPWNLAAYAVVEVPGALPLAALIGAYGISFLVVRVNVACAEALRRGRWGPVLEAGGVALLALVLGLVIRPGVPSQEATGEVRVLQPNIPNLTQWDRRLIEENYRQVIRQASAACEPGALLVLPESATWPYVYGRDAHLADDLDRIADRGCVLLVNSVSEVGEAYYNSLLMVGGEGVEGRYDKRHLVPFGEYVPFGGLMAWFDKLARMAGDYQAGEEAGLLAWGDELLGPAICYEVVYAGNVAKQVRAGATVLVTVTNDAWYGDTSAPWQHLRAARFRAAEHARPMLRAAITGVSVIIAADGSVVSQLGVGEKGVLEARVAGRRKLTLYARAPWLMPLTCCLISLSGWIGSSRPYARLPEP